jgi:predicted ester cyclase
MTNTTNQEVIRRFVKDVMERGSMTAADELLDPEFVNHTPPPGLPPTRDGMKLLVTTVRAGIPDVAPVIDELISVGDVVVMRDHASGTQTGPLFGAPASGKRATWREIHIWKVRNGRIVEHWGIEDMLALLAQLRLVQPPGA